jgi:hypothetical protein
MIVSVIFSQSNIYTKGTKYRRFTRLLSIDSLKYFGAVLTSRIHEQTNSLYLIGLAETCRFTS